MKYNYKNIDVINSYIYIVICTWINIDIIYSYKNYIHLVYL